MLFGFEAETRTAQLLCAYEKASTPRLTFALIPAIVRRRDENPKSKRSYFSPGSLKTSYTHFAD